MGLFTPKSREEQAYYDYHENARFREDLRENKRKSEVRSNLRFRKRNHILTKKLKKLKMLLEGTKESVESNTKQQKQLLA